MKKTCLFIITLILFLTTYSPAQNYEIFTGCADDYDLYLHPGLSVPASQELEYLRKNDVRLYPVVMKYPYRLALSYTKKEGRHLIIDGFDFEYAIGPTPPRPIVDTDPYYIGEIIFVNEDTVVADISRTLDLDCRFIIWHGSIFINQSNPYYISALEARLRQIHRSWGPVVTHGTITKEELNAIMAKIKK